MPKTPKRTIKDTEEVQQTTPPKKDSGSDLGSHHTPPKNIKLDDDELQNQSPSPSRLLYQMTTLDAALNHYFSPKKKSPSRPAQRKIIFSPEKSEEENDNSSDENRVLEQRMIYPRSDGIAVREYDYADVKHCFNELDNHLMEGRQKTFDARSMFRHWLGLLKSGEFNILVHGLGSKEKLFNQFREYLSAYPVFVVDGFSSGMSISLLLDQINIHKQLNISRKRRTLPEWAMDIVRAIDRKTPNGQFLVIIVQNIDSPQLRPRIQQEAFSKLAGARSIRLLASVHHVNAALVWDQTLRDAFAWLYFTVSTLHSYRLEMLLAHSKLLGLNTKGNIQTHTMESLDTFWEATTANMRKILENLALYAPMHSERNRWDPLSIPRFCQILKEHFATTSETALRQQLVEFCDHNIIQFDQEENIHLMVDRQLLSSFLENKIAASG